MRFRNPVFEVTPAHLVTGIITEKGFFQPSEVSDQFKSMRRCVESFLRNSVECSK
ncbi:MAG: hypothetical protein ACLFVP_09825 [Candidatus Bathyarchaeia archaeon]